MKNFVFLYIDNKTSYSFEKVFSNKSAFALCLEWVKNIQDCAGASVFTTKDKEALVSAELENAGFKAKVIVKDTWACIDLVKSMAQIMADAKAVNAIYTSADKPFIDSALTKEVLDCHEKYIAEYTFAEGYPYGFAPEVIHAGTLNILATLGTEKFTEEGQAAVNNECIFNLLKKDVNSFEVEAVLAPKDYRLLRFDFSCGTKRNFIACQRLYKKAEEKNIPFAAVALSDLAESCADIQQTLPSFYNVQISSKLNSVPLYVPEKNFNTENMPLEKFAGLVAQIKDFSDDAVIGLSAFGEPLLLDNLDAYVAEVLKHENLSVLIETDGTLVTKELAEKISNISRDRVIWIVSIDAASAAMYEKIVRGGSFEKAVSSISVLEPLFPKNVYPQLTRINENEDELEAFYRYWHDQNSPSKGKLIIQKYDDCCKTLPARKPADLSPLERNVCWHLKRDMTILADGTVPLCKQFALSSSLGNVFEEGIEKIWNKTLPDVEKHIAGEYGQKCRDCDEYYTFNF